MQRLTYAAALIAAFLLLTAITFGEDVSIDGDLTVATYVKHHDLTAGALASVGVGAPVGACCGNLCGFGLDNLNEVLSFGAVEIASEWDGASDMTMHVHAVVTDSDPIADTEDIDIDASWRSIVPGTETGKQGTAVTATDTHLQSGGGAGAECETIVFSFTIPYTGGNQPLTVGDDLGIFFNRNPGTEANSYSGSIIPYKGELLYNATKMPTH